MNNEYNPNTAASAEEIASQAEPATENEQPSPADTTEAAPDSSATESVLDATSAEPSAMPSNNSEAQPAQSAHAGDSASPNGYALNFAPYGYANPPSYRPYGAYAGGGFSPPPPQTHGFGYGVPPYQQGRPSYPNGSPHTTPSSSVGQSSDKQRGGASKGFVIGALAIGLVISLLLGIVIGIGFAPSGNSLGTLGGGTVIIEHVTKGEEPVITDKGDVAYAASVAAKTVVDIVVERASNTGSLGQSVTQAAGSGVIISSGEDGTYILTCAHLIKNATAATVRTQDGTVYKATALAPDTDVDIGIIKLDVKGLPTATIADYDDVVVGEEVVTIGNALGELSGSVTNGLVRAVSRSVVVDGNVQKMLQTNTALNHGNSGGGIFNMDGELIGIISAKSTGEDIDGLGFAVPIDVAMDIAKELIENGFVTGRVKLGFQLIQIASEADIQSWWQYRNYFTDFGIYIIISEDSQFLEGDRLIAINNETVSDLVDLKDMLTKYEVGQTVSITISRKNNTTGKAELHEFDLVLTEKTA